MDYQGQNGLMTTHREGLRSRGPSAFLLAFALTAFYLDLYFEDRLARITGQRWLSDLAEWLGLNNRWYLYGLVYSVVMLAGAAVYLRRHGNSRYNRVRIATNVLVQIVLGFSLPFFMATIGQRDFYFSYLWPLKIEYLYPQDLAQFPIYIVVYSVVASLVAVPLLTIRFGKRWYCSWICGCGGLANTFGDPWRHLTSTSTRAWRFEEVSVHTVLVLALSTTAMVALDYLIGGHAPTFHAAIGEMRSLYGLVVGAILAGVVGVGFYPLLGPRVWCRNFCPMAATLGLVQKLGRFQIRVKPDMCISCGNCSAYCEMGIDVRAYAQRNESFTRAACVGCGMCAHVCPRGVLRLENATGRDRRSGLATGDRNEPAKTPLPIVAD